MVSQLASQYMRKKTINQDDDREPTLALDLINADNLLELVKACMKQGVGDYEPINKND